MSYGYKNSLEAYDDIDWDAMDNEAGDMLISDCQALRRIIHSCAKPGDRDKPAIVKFFKDREELFEQTGFAGCAFEKMNNKLSAEAAVSGVSGTSPMYQCEQWDYEENTMTFNGGMIYNETKKHVVARASNFTVGQTAESLRKVIVAVRCAAVVEINSDKQVDMCFDGISANKLNQSVPLTLFGIKQLVRDLNVEPSQATGVKMAHQIYTKLSGLTDNDFNKFVLNLNHFFFSHAITKKPQCFDWSGRAQRQMVQLGAYTYSMPKDPVVDFGMGITELERYLAASRTYRLTNKKGMSGVTSGYIDGVIMTDAYADVLDVISTLRGIITDRTYHYILAGVSAMQLHYVASNFSEYNMTFITKASLPPLCKIPCVSSVSRMYRPKNTHFVLIEYEGQYTPYKKGKDYKEYCMANLRDMHKIAENYRYQGFHEVYFRVNGLTVKLPRYRVLRQPHNGMIMYHIDLSDAIVESQGSVARVVPSASKTDSSGVTTMIKAGVEVPSLELPNVPKTDSLETTTMRTVGIEVLSPKQEADGKGKEKEKVDLDDSDDESSDEDYFGRAKVPEPKFELEPNVMEAKFSPYNGAGLTHHQFLNVVFIANYARNMLVWSPMIVGNVLKNYGYKFEPVTIIPRVKPEKERASDFYSVKNPLDLSTYMDPFKFEYYKLNSDGGSEDDEKSSTSVSKKKKKVKKEVDSDVAKMMTFNLD